MLKQSIKGLLNRLPYVSSLWRQVQEQGAYPAGHYYSPIPAKGDVIEWIERKDNERLAPTVPGLDLRKHEQFALLQEYSQYYSDIPFSEEKSNQHRYYFNNEFFCHSDAIFLYCFLRHFKPRRIIEIGSGFSSAVMLDTLDLHSYGQVDITFVEPFPERLRGLLRSADNARITIIEKKVQDVDLKIFSGLTPGDLLFIDSSHVVKLGSDVQKIFFNIIPSLPMGVFLHFHDIFANFEYPLEWLSMGRYWNEDYLLRAFLSYNETWAILFFNNYVGHVFKDDLQAKMPLCLKDIGGSIYLKRTK
jgi:hypothetical protein